MLGKGNNSEVQRYWINSTLARAELGNIENTFVEAWWPCPAENALNVVDNLFYVTDGQMK